MEFLQIVAAVIIGVMAGAILGLLGAPDWVCGLVAGGVTAGSIIRCW